MRCVPPLKVNFFATWSFHFWYFFTPSIHTSRRWTPAGELPLAFTSTGEVTLALFAGPQILAARFAELGAVQLATALVLVKASHPSLIQVDTARSWRESRLKSRASRSAMSKSLMLACVPKLPFPLPNEYISPPPKCAPFMLTRSMFWSPLMSVASSNPPADGPIRKEDTRV